MNNIRQEYHAAMLLSNGYEPDRRVQKEAHTLAAAGYRVTVIAWDRECRLPVHATEQAPAPLAAALTAWSDQLAGEPCPVSIVRVQVPAGYGTGRQLLRKMPLFWWRALSELRRIRPAVVHAHDLDTLPLACCYGWLADVPVIFDAHEFFPGMVQASIGERLSRTLEIVERALVPRVAAVLTIGTRLADHYRAMGARVEIVHNSHPLPDQDTLDMMGQAKRRSLGVPEDALLVVYIGMLTPDRLISPVLEAVAGLDNAWLVVGGTGPQQAVVQTAAANCDRIRVLGWVPPDEVLAMVAAGDVVYYGLDARSPNSPYFMPNLAFHALAAGRPLLVTPVGEIAEVVRQTGCGIVLEAATGAAAQRALERFVDVTYRVTLGQQARYICQEQYNWSFSAAHLLALYRRVSNTYIIQD
jgi:glycosyltransferase involved in cell wall biosynthesis